MNIRILLAASSLTLALTGAAQAATTHHGHVSKVRVSTDRHWHNWGANPFAKDWQEALSAAKFDKFLADAESSKSSVPMPARVAEAFKKAVHDRPEGTVTYITPGVVLPIMESGDGPMYNVQVDELPVSFGIYKAAQVRAWAVLDQDTGIMWTIGGTVICRNLSVLKLERVGAMVTPPPMKHGCNALHIIGDAGDQVHIRDLAPEALIPDSCGPTLQEAGQPLTAAHLPDQPCEYFDKYCGFEGPLDTLHKQVDPDPRIVVQTFPVINFTIKNAGDQVLWVSDDTLDKWRKHRITICVTHHYGLPDQADSKAQTVEPPAYVDGNAYVLLELHQRTLVPANYRGPVQVMVYERSVRHDSQ